MFDFPPHACLKTTLFVSNEYLPLTTVVMPAIILLSRNYSSHLTSSAKCSMSPALITVSQVWNVVTLRSSPELNNIYIKVSNWILTCCHWCLNRKRTIFLHLNYNLTVVQNTSMNQPSNLIPCILFALFKSLCENFYVTVLAVDKLT